MEPCEANLVIAIIAGAVIPVATLALLRALGGYWNALLVALGEGVTSQVWGSSARGPGLLSHRLGG